NKWIEMRINASRERGTYDMWGQALCLPEHIEGRRQAPLLHDGKSDLLDSLWKSGVMIIRAIIYHRIEMQ
ncbi:MAG: hypothetical protein JW941_03700, partial [Candidatus Coatesbacteria bacterium]|nr:hypothetical protein [Candidatus Coatesbacteria bacterium]